MLQRLLNRLEELAGDKHSSLLRKFVNYGQNKFYKIRPRVGITVVANTLAYYNTATITAVKRFIDPDGVNLVGKFTHSFYVS
jgi:hypothetical protein